MVTVSCWSLWFIDIIAGKDHWSLLSLGSLNDSSGTMTVSPQGVRASPGNFPFKIIYKSTVPSMSAVISKDRLIFVLYFVSKSYAFFE